MNDNSVVASRFTDHLIRPVPQITRHKVDLFVGTKRHAKIAMRPTHFDRLLLVSSWGKSAPDHGGRFTRSKRVIASNLAPLRPDVYLDTRPICEPNNIAHLLSELIPLALLAKQAVGEVDIVCWPLQNERFRELLAYFGIEPICTRRQVLGQRLEYFVTRGLAAYQLPAFDCPTYSMTGEVYADYIKPAVGCDRLFLSRRGARALTNEREVAAFLEARGYRTVYLEDYSIADQVSIVQAASSIVAVHGAALGYLVLKDKAIQVVELLPPNVYHAFFPVLMGHKVERYTQLLPEFDPHTQFSGWAEIQANKQRPFAVNLQALELALD